MNLKPLAILCFPAALLLASAGCGNAPEAEAEAKRPAAADSALEVTYLMGHLGNYTNKVGWATAAQNPALAGFYLDKMDQVLAEMLKIERWEGIPIGGMAQATMGNSLKALRSKIDEGDWAGAGETYRGMTLACNSCHAATRREYVVIEPVGETPAPGQRFSAP